MGQKLPEGAVLHRQGYLDPIDGSTRPAVTACGQPMVKGTWVTDGTQEKVNCEACNKAK